MTRDFDPILKLLSRVTGPVVKVKKALDISKLSWYVEGLKVQSYEFLARTNTKCVGELRMKDEPWELESIKVLLDCSKETNFE